MTIKEQLKEARDLARKYRELYVTYYGEFLIYFDGDYNGKTIKPLKRHKLKACKFPWEK